MVQSLKPCNEAHCKASDSWTWQVQAAASKQKANPAAVKIRSLRLRGSQGWRCRLPSVETLLESLLSSEDLTEPRTPMCHLSPLRTDTARAHMCL
jgi:hypothetical protein